MKKIFVAVSFYIIDICLYMVNFIQKITEKFFFHAIKFQYMSINVGSRILPKREENGQVLSC